MATATRTLYFRDESTNSDKVYTAILDGGTVTFKWGRRGASMQSKTFGPMSDGAARAKFANMLDAKLAKGYRDELLKTGKQIPMPAAAQPKPKAASNPWTDDNFGNAPVKPIPPQPSRLLAPIAQPGVRKFRHE